MNLNLKNAARTFWAIGCLFAAPDTFASCEEAIKDFYVSYMQNANDGNDKANDQLKRLHMSPDVIAKMNEYTQLHGIDAIIHAQDVSRYGIESITVGAMHDNWYMVKYKWDADSKETMIPIQVCDCDTTFKILDILPIETDDN